MQKQAVEFLAGQCIAVLNQGIELIKNLDDDQFTRCTDSGNGSIGAHFRHVIDFVDRFLNGVETGRIDYNLRDRDLMIEKNRNSAVVALANLTRKLENLDEKEIDQSLLLHLERGNFVSEDAAWCETSLLRELEFVQSHALHHFALIAAKLDVRGIPVPDHFGVAPSTLDFWKSQKSLKVSG
jgi:uncharacterized damage-inducible protein DinB